MDGQTDGRTDRRSKHYMPWRTFQAGGIKTENTVTWLNITWYKELSWKQCAKHVVGARRNGTKLVRNDGHRTPSFYYMLNAVIFLMARVRIKGIPIYFILYKRTTHFLCEYSVKWTVLWNFNMHICISISINSLFSHVLRCTITLQCTRIYVHMFQMRAQYSYYANRFCRGQSVSYSSKTCLICIICTLEYVRCSNGTMNNTSSLILWYRLWTDLRALMNL